MESVNIFVKHFPQGFSWRAHDDKMKCKDECEQTEMSVLLSLNSKCPVQIIVTISGLTVCVNYRCKIWFIFIIKLTNANERIVEEKKHEHAHTHTQEERIINEEHTMQRLSARNKLKDM